MEKLQHLKHLNSDRDLAMLSRGTCLRTEFHLVIEMSFSKINLGIHRLATSDQKAYNAIDSPNALRISIEA